MRVGGTRKGVWRRYELLVLARVRFPGEASSGPLQNWNAVTTTSCVKGETRTLSGGATVVEGGFLLSHSHPVQHSGITVVVEDSGQVGGPPETPVAHVKTQEQVLRHADNRLVVQPTGLVYNQGKYNNRRRFNSMVLTPIQTAAGLRLRTGD